MPSRAVGIFARVSRLDTSLIVWLSLAVPLYFRLHDLDFVLVRSLPLLAISMCGFILNDIHDIERDRENHPNRPLVQGQLSEAQAAILYFVLLGAALVALRIYVDPATTFLYLLLLIALINYNYVVSYFPYLKNVYVASAGIIPLILLSRLEGARLTLLVPICALFGFLLGRELLMDVQDSHGDGHTLAKKLGPKTSSIVGFVLKFISCASLLAAAQNNWSRGCALTMILLDIVFVFMWPKHNLARAVIHAMKIQLLIGIAYIALS